MISIARFSIFALFVGLLAPVVRAAPRDELLRLVPDDMSFCAVLQNLRDKAQTDLAARLAEMPFVKIRLESPEITKLRAIQEQVLKELGITPQQLRDDLLGDAAVFAYRAGPPDDPKREQALFLVWARDKALLARVLERINQMQEKTGELTELRAVEYHGQTYTLRIKKEVPKGATECYFIRDNLLIFATREAAIREALDRARLRPAADKGKSFWAKMLDGLGFDKAVVAVLINPRAFDQALALQEGPARGPEKGFLKEFRRYWQTFDGLGFYADAGANLEFGLAVQVRTDALPRPAQQFFGELGRPSALWQAVPDDALFALAARTDLAALTEVFSGFCDETSRQQMHESLVGSLRPFLPEGTSFERLMKGLGPDWGIWLERPAADDKTWAPRAMLAIKVQDTADGAAAEKLVRNAIQFVSTLAQLTIKDGMRVETIADGKTEIKCFTSATHFPPGVRPAFAVKDGYLLFAGSPEMIRRFTAPAALKDGEEAPILRISAQGWRQYLAEHKNEIADPLGKLLGKPAKEVVTQIDDLLPNLKALDRFEIVVRGKPNLATLTLRLKLAKP